MLALNAKKVKIKNNIYIYFATMSLWSCSPGKSAGSESKLLGHLSICYKT